MSTRKRNEWLDAAESDNEERGYDSEEESRSRMLPTSKRQKRDHSSDDEDDQDVSDDDGAAVVDKDDADDLPSKSAELERLEQLAANLPTELKLQTGKPLGLMDLKKDKSGVIYISRVPPFMKPAVLRSLLTPYGAVGRIFLTPESTTSRQQRLRGGGTRRKLYLDGWVEFLKKKDAKFVAENLNSQTMGGKKRGRWHDEIWNIKYLSGVKWTHLVEQIQNENAERAARLRFEIAQSKKENARFLQNVEKGKMISGVEATRKKRGDGGDDNEVQRDTQEATGAKDGSDKPRRVKGKSVFTQHAATSKADKKPEPGQNVQRVLSQIF
jgi:ESF2/ABP1 family protein